MTGERWQEIRNVLETALQMDSEKRRAYLDQVCALDQSLRGEVESLLAADKQAQTSFLQSPPLTTRLEKGTRLGDYEIQSLVGAGGMGEVYRARDLRLRRDVAVKVLPAVVSSNPERLRRFEQEARAAAALNHPNILAVHQLGTYAGTSYMVSELLEGETLREQIRRGRVAALRVIDYGVQIAHGLAAAHEKGIVHRDLKPENLYLTKDGRVKILDFGLAKLTQSQAGSEHSAPTIGGETEPGLVMGTVGYMSPEQVRGQASDHRADTFAFGAILYEMLTSQRAFQKPTSLETMAAILNEDPHGISQITPGLPPALQRIVHRCLEKNPEQRFQSASDLAFALEALSGSGASPANPDTSREKSPRITAWIVIGAVAAVLVAGLTVTWPMFRSQPQTVHSIAVLPFASPGQDAGAEDLSDGVTEAIIDALSQMPDMKVMARGSVFRYKHKEVDPQQAGRDMKVDAVLTGQITRRGNDLLVSTELEKVEDGTHLWGAQYNRNAASILALQQEIASDISQRLQPRLSSGQKQKISRLPTDNLEAYQLYVKGRYFFDRWNEGGRKKALEYFEQAVTRDPGFAAAFAGLADTYSLRGFFGEATNLEESAKGMAAARKALALDNSLAEAHASLGLALLLDLQWTEAEKQLRQAISLNANSSICHSYYAWYLVFAGRGKEAFPEMETAQVLDPLSSIPYATAGDVYYFARDFDGAILQLQKAIEFDPSNPDPHKTFGDTYLEKHMCSEATKEYAISEELLGNSQNAVALTKAFESSGCHGMLRKQLEFYSDPSNPDYYPMSAGITAVLLGEKDQGFEFLEKAFEAKQGIIWLKAEPELDGVRSDPRYADLLRRVGLPQ
ncbi:MAG TPA: protein kinase [Candidatus Dormibacteraeota bacterium]|nr:protein kinase [Candidatus Dormibacteraeota bacterium]